MSSLEERKEQMNAIKELLEKDEGFTPPKGMDSLLDKIEESGYKVVEKNKVKLSTSVSQFEERAKELIQLAKETRQRKNPAYSGKNEDYHGNFRKMAKLLDSSDLEVAMVYFMKHITAIASFAKDPSIHQEEEMEGRFGDALNYLLFLWSMYKDK